MRAIATRSDASSAPAHIAHELTAPPPPASLFPRKLFAQLDALEREAPAALPGRGAPVPMESHRLGQFSR